MKVVLAAALLLRLAGEALEAGVRRDSERSVALLVVRHDPGLPGLRRLAPPLQHPLVRHVPLVLERRAGESGALAEERPVHEVLVARVRVDHDEVPVRVELAERRRHRALLVGGLRVLLAEVPVEGELVAEAGHELPVVEEPLDAHRPAVERLGHRSRRALVAEPLVVDLGLLRLEVQVEAERLRVVEDDLPLVELRAVVVELQVALDERPDVVAVAPGVVGQEGEGVHPPARQVVERPDQALALAALPGRVARPPVAHVGRPGLEGDVRLPRHRPVEVGIAEEGLRGIRPRLQEVLAAPGEPQVVAARVLRAARGPGSRGPSCRWGGR